MLQVWQQDANELGLPENVQKGVIFLIALGMRVDPAFETPEAFLRHAQKLSSQISLSPPHIPDGIGGDFYDGIIEKLLTEFAERSYLPFESRQIEGTKVWKRGAEDRLPACLGSETSLLHDWDNVMTTLCGLIGDQINDDLEGAFIDGFLFFDSYYHFDIKGTSLIAELATKFFPSHLVWFQHCLNFEPEYIRQGNPVPKVLTGFLGPEDPIIHPHVSWFADFLHFSGPGQKRQEVWDANLSRFTVIAGIAQTRFHEKTSESWYAPAYEKLQQGGFKTPKICTSTVEVAELLQEQVYNNWGYDILAESECPSLGAQFTRRSCICLFCVANGILQPTWNHFARSS